MTQAWVFPHENQLVEWHIKVFSLGMIRSQKRISKNDLGLILRKPFKIGHMLVRYEKVY